MKRVLIGMLALGVLGVAFVYANYATWRASQFDALGANAQVVETAQGPIQFVLEGPDGAPVLLFLHGTPGGCDQTIPAPGGARVLSPSRPGYLGTPLEAGRSPADQADAYAALLDELGIESVVVMGASGGGPSALAFAERHPSRTRALIALEAVSQSMPLETIPGFLQSDFAVWLMLRAMGLGGDDAMVRRLVPDVANQERLLADPAGLARFEATIWSLWPPSERMEGWNNDVEAFAAFDVPVESIRVPTLIVHGTEDVAVPIQHARDLALAIPHAEVKILDGADHMMPFSHAQEVEAAIEDFLVRNGASARAPAAD